MGLWWKSSTQSMAALEKGAVHNKRGTYSLLMIAAEGVKLKSFYPFAFYWDVGQT